MDLFGEKETKDETKLVLFITGFFTFFIFLIYLDILFNNSEVTKLGLPESKKIWVFSAVIPLVFLQRLFVLLFKKKN